MQRRSKSPARNQRGELHARSAEARQAVDPTSSTRQGTNTASATFNAYFVFFPALAAIAAMFFIAAPASATATATFAASAATAVSAATLSASTYAATLVSSAAVQESWPLTSLVVLLLLVHGLHLIFFRVVIFFTALLVRTLAPSGPRGRGQHPQNPHNNIRTIRGYVVRRPPSPSQVTPDSMVDGSMVTCSIFLMLSIHAIRDYGATRGFEFDGLWWQNAVKFVLMRTPREIKQLHFRMLAPLAPWSYATVLLHGDYLHLANNMIAFGLQHFTICKAVGNVAFTRIVIALVVIAELFANIVHATTVLYFGPDLAPGPSVGFSGVLCGISALRFFTEHFSYNIDGSRARPGVHVDSNYTIDSINTVIRFAFAQIELPRWLWPFFEVCVFQLLGGDNVSLSGHLFGTAAGSLLSLLVIWTPGLIA